MIRKLILMGSLSIFGSIVHAAGLDFNLGGDSAEIRYLFSSDAQIGVGGTDIGAGLYFNENDDYVFTGSLLVVGNSTGRNRALQLGAGVKAYAGTLERSGEDTVGAIGVGGRVAYIFPSMTPMAVTTELYYAPNITSFGDNDRFYEVLVRFEIEVAPTTRFYVGYRQMEARLELENVDYELDASAHLGVRFSF
jgi:hypothetical protein